MVQNKGPIEKHVSGYFSKELHVTFPRSSYIAKCEPNVENEFVVEAPRPNLASHGGKFCQ